MNPGQRSVMLLARNQIISVRRIVDDNSNFVHVSKCQELWKAAPAGRVERRGSGLPHDVTVPAGTPRYRRRSTCQKQCGVNECHTFKKHAATAKDSLFKRPAAAFRCDVISQRHASGADNHDIAVSSHIISDVASDNDVPRLI
jgi:hypothetical protein